MTTPSAGPRLLGPAEVRSLAAELDLRPTKQRGQNFVIDANTVRRIVRDSGIGPGDVVVEVGPGLGSLTLGLLEVAKRVVAVEVDPLLAERLPATIAEYAPDHVDAFEVVLGDAMRIEQIPGPPPTALVANLPYNVSVPVLIHMLTLLPSLERGLVMVQAEVADRLAAGPGSKIYGVPSVKAAWFAEVRRAGSIGRNVFWPAPNVDSGLVAWTRCDPPDTTATREQVFTVIDAAFATRRKQIRAALRPLAGSSEAAERALTHAGIDPTARGEVLDRGRLRPDRRGHAVVTVFDLPRSVSVRAAAKINLHLGVGAVRDDGFHPLDTVYQAISLYDDVTLAPAGMPSLALEVADYVDRGDIPLGGDNIAFRALDLIRARTGRPGTEKLHILQVDPGRRRHGGRLGRRGRDPAGLRPPPRRWACPTACSSSSRPSWAATSRSRSSGGTARGRGRGEVVQPLDDRGTWWWVAVPSDDGPVDARGLPALRPPVSRRAGASPPSRPTCCPLWRAASRSGWRAPCTTTCRRRPSTSGPSSAP